MMLPIAPERQRDIRVRDSDAEDDDGEAAMSERDREKMMRSER